MDFKTIVGYCLQMSELSWLELLSFLVMPVMIEPVFLEKIKVAIHMMIAFTVDIFKAIQTRFFF